jgi:hypothetical protein
MKNLPLLIGGAIAALIGFNLFAKKRAVENLQITPGALKINLPRTKDANFFRIFYGITLNIFNPVNASINIRGIFLKVFFDGQEIGSIINQDEFSILPRATVQSKLEASVNSVSLIGLLTNLIKTGFNIDNINRRFTYSGFIETEAGRIDISQQKF